MIKLLIVEHEPRILAGLVDNFEYEGYEVISAEHPSEAMTRALDESPDVVLLDVMLPNVSSGLYVCMKLKGKQPSLPIVVLTPNELVDNLVDDQVMMPFSIRDLSNRVRSVLRRVQKKREVVASSSNIEANRHVQIAAAQRNSSNNSHLRCCHSPERQSEVFPLIGRTLGHYRVLSKMSTGGMGVVFMAYDERLGRKVALKVLRTDKLADKQARAHLLEEARNAASLNHPNICAIYDLGEAQGETYIVMELVVGQALNRLIGEHGLPSKAIIRYGTQIANALTHAHAQGIIHRDLKSSNVVVKADGCAKVLDFGLSRRLQPCVPDAITQSLGCVHEIGPLVGTIYYLAPEILCGEEADARCDLWSFGVLLYEAVLGTLPFRGETAFAVSAAILHQPPPPLPSRVPLGLRAIIERCLLKNPNQRYQHFSEVSAAFQALVHLGQQDLHLASSRCQAQIPLESE